MATPKKPAQKPPPKVVQPVVKAMTATLASPSVKLPFPNADTAREKMGLHLPGDQPPTASAGIGGIPYEPRPPGLPAPGVTDAANRQKRGGPTPNAAAVEHANPNARFKRGPGKPKDGPNPNARRPEAWPKNRQKGSKSKPVRKSRT